MKWAIVGNTGDGKTLAMVIIFNEKLIENPEREIYGNLHLEFPNSHFTPVMFLPFSQLQSCLIAYDDIDEDETYLKGFISASAKRSRKEFMDLFFTCQYYTQLPRKLRKMIDFRVVPAINKGIINIKIYQKKVGLISDKNYVAKDYYHLYNTYEVVDDPTESDILKEIAKNSFTPRDIEKNLMIYTGNRAERKALYNEIYELTEFGKAEISKKRKKKEKEAKKRLRKAKNQKQELIDYLVNNIRLNESKAYIKGKLYQKCDILKGGSLISEDLFSEIIMRAIAIYRDKKFEEEQALEEEEQEEKKNNDYDIKILMSFILNCLKHSENEVLDTFGIESNNKRKVRTITHNKIGFKFKRGRTIITEDFSTIKEKLNKFLGTF